jgi:drug/metabolite transporter (DMT)-like permease
MYHARLQWQPVAVLMLLALIWGANMAIIKIGSREVAPLFMAGLRSLVAGVCLYTWMKVKGFTIFPSKRVVLHGMVIGFLFGAEFGLVYVGLEYTLTCRVYVLLYTAPFFVALQAHFLLDHDRFNPWKALGLLLAFAGVVTLFLKDLGALSTATLPGDLMALCAAIFWGSTTVYIKKFLVDRASALQTLFYQVLFSAPFLFGLSLCLEKPLISGFSATTAFAVFYQCIVVAFLSYLVWFELVRRYPVSLLHAFSFFTPIFGVFISGLIIMGEPIGLDLMAALILVCLGMVLVNYHPPGKAKTGFDTRIP